MATNGNLPLSGLTPVAHFTPYGSAINRDIGSDRLYPIAARQFALLQAAHQAKFGSPLQAAECYRPLVRQNVLWQLYQAKGPGWTRAAKPGTSNHGWAKAVDIRGAAAAAGTAEHTWLDSVVRSYGLALDVAGEPWHLTYIGNPTITIASTTKPITIPKEDEMTKDEQDTLTASLILAADPETTQHWRLSINGVYKNRLGRPADTGGMRNSLRAMALGKTITWVDASVMASAEYKNRKK